MKHAVAAPASFEPAPGLREQPGLLTLLRHGQSRANRALRFTGWDDAGLSAQGRQEAARAGRLLGAGERPVDVCFTSMLGRAMHTAEIALAEASQAPPSIRPCWRLNERHYGSLQGLTPWTAAWHYGPLRVLRCRYLAGERPPLLAECDARSPRRDPRYAAVDPSLLPRTESLLDVATRIRPCWHERIAPELARGRHVLVVSHRHLLRVLLELLGEPVPRRGFACAEPRMVRFAPGDARLSGP